MLKEKTFHCEASY